jgi:hypothetical protein
MPSPFPGMDLHLEGELRQEFHETLAGAIRAQLLPWLAPKAEACGQLGYGTLDTRPYDHDGKPRQRGWWAQRPTARPAVLRWRSWMKQATARRPASRRAPRPGRAPAWPPVARK